MMFVDLLAREVARNLERDNRTRDEAAELLNAAQSYSGGGAQIKLGDAFSFSVSSLDPSQDAIHLAMNAFLVTPVQDGFGEAECLVRLGWSPGDNPEDF